MVALFKIFPTFGYFSGPSSTCCTDLSQCCFLGTDIWWWQRFCPWLWAGGTQGSQPQRGDSSPPWTIYHWGRRGKGKLEIGTVPNFTFTGQLYVYGRMGFRVFFLGLCLYELLVVRFGWENCVHRIASEGLCPYVWACRCRRKLNL